tara:strand:- start:7820 stop:8110 length:291 start_codon:yes stop_codon:yes gene_type:complete
MYNSGTIKVAWYQNKDYNLLYSQMFSNKEEALKFSKNIDDFMLMELVDTTNDKYKWKVLPYGNYNQYNYGMKIFKNKFILYGLSLLCVYGVYKIIK